MSRLDSSRLVVGYHGTDERVVRKVLDGKLELRSSIQDYDWLGNGVYFWEQGPRRALEFASEMAALNRNEIQSPSILGAYINLGDCLDLLDTANTRDLASFYRSFKGQFAGLKNERTREDGTKLFHRLDCAVINSFVAHVKEFEGRSIDSVRGCFWEGNRIFPGAEFREKSHIQIAVRNPQCVIGYFRPTKTNLLPEES